ncbi:unnamed protein product, partial [Soboliphyme baturini]|uniref:AAA domain-containing protein n=1 Tax=Soboliphyme baturini TaxID=241478 RepID=A0A183J4Z8_9BILA
MIVNTAFHSHSLEVFQSNLDLLKLEKFDFDSVEGAEDAVASRRFRYVPGKPHKRSSALSSISNAVQIGDEPEFITGGMELAKRRNQGTRSASYRCASKPSSYLTALYGQSVKSLGTVRNSFKPPVKTDCVEHMPISTKPVSSEDHSQLAESSSEATTSGNETIRNCDPKLIDQILCEIIHRQPSVTWDEVAGLESAKRAIREMVIWPMLRPDIFTGLRAPSKGMLLFGPPGTGKTLIGKCIASQCKATFFSVSASSLTSKWVGEGEKLVRALFAVARDRLPSVIFIDEVDSLLTQRSDGEHESSRRLKNEFFSQMDGLGISKEERLLVVGATNRPQELDEAARRRFAKRLYIPLPDKTARVEIVQHLLHNQRHTLTDSEIATVGDLTDGEFSLTLFITLPFWR